MAESAGGLRSNALCETGEPTVVGRSGAIGCDSYVSRRESSRDEACVVWFHAGTSMVTSPLIKAWQARRQPGFLARIFFSPSVRSDSSSWPSITW